MHSTVGFNACKCLGPTHTVHQPWVNSYMYFGLSTVEMAVAPLYLEEVQLKSLHLFAILPVFGLQNSVPEAHQN